MTVGDGVPPVAIEFELNNINTTTQAALTTKRDSTEPRVDRQFRRTRPNELWLTDITEHPTREGKVYCAVVLDAFSRRVVGWSISHNPTAALTCNALGMAIEQRDAVRGTVIHSDHGTQFTAWTFSDRAQDVGAAALDGHRSVTAMTTR